VPDPVEHDLGDGAFAIVVLVACLIVDCACKAFERALAGGGVALEYEGRRRGIGSAGERDRLIDPQCLIGGDLLDEERRRGRRLVRFRAWPFGHRVGGSAQRNRGHRPEQAESHRLARIGAPQPPRAQLELRRSRLERPKRALAGQGLRHASDIAT